MPVLFLEQRRYCTTRKELLAVLKSTRQFLSLSTMGKVYGSNRPPQFYLAGEFPTTGGSDRTLARGTYSVKHGFLASPW